MNFYIILGAIALFTYGFGQFTAIVLRRGAISAERFLPAALFFSAGLLMGTALFHLLPESIEMIGSQTGLAILAGFVIFYAPQKYIITQPCEMEEAKPIKPGLLVFAGIALHSMIDGIGVGAAELVEKTSEVAIAIVVHKFTAAFALAVFLTGEKLTPLKMSLYLLFFSLATPTGAALTHFTLSPNDTFTGFALGFSAGNLTAIASGDLMRKYYREEKRYRALQLFLFLSAIALTALGLD